MRYYVSSMLGIFWGCLGSTDCRYFCSAEPVDTHGDIKFIICSFDISVDDLMMFLFFDNISRIFGASFASVVWIVAYKSHWLFMRITPVPIISAIPNVKTDKKANTDIIAVINVLCSRIIEKTTGFCFIIYFQYRQIALTVR